MKIQKKNSFENEFFYQYSFSNIMSEIIIGDMPKTVSLEICQKPYHCNFLLRPCAYRIHLSQTHFIFYVWNDCRWMGVGARNSRNGLKTLLGKNCFPDTCDTIQFFPQATVLSLSLQLWTASLPRYYI